MFFNAKASFVEISFFLFLSCFLSRFEMKMIKIYLENIWCVCMCLWLKIILNSLLMLFHPNLIHFLMFFGK